MEDYFRQLAEEAPRWNFIWMYEERQQGKILSGLWMTIKLSVMCLIFSVIIGVVGAWMQGAPSRIVRAIVQGYIQFFRNTPPMVQLLFFYFALGQFTPAVLGDDGWTLEPIISNVGWAIISLSMDTDHHQPFIFLHALGIILRIGQICISDGARFGNLALRAAADKHRLAAPCHGNALAGLNG